MIWDLNIKELLLEPIFFSHGLLASLFQSPTALEPPSFLPPSLGAKKSYSPELIAPEPRPL